MLRGKMSFVGPRPDVPGYADKLVGDDRDVLKLRPGITGPATFKYRLEDEMISEYVAKKQAEGDPRPTQEIAVEYNDMVIYPDKVRLNCYYYRHYSFIKDIQRFMFDVLGEDTIDLIDAEYDHPSGCTLIDPYQSPGHSKSSTERLGVFYRFVPVSYDITCTKGFGYIIQDDMYKYIEDLEGNWKIIIYSYSKENPPEILDENDNYQEVEICGWQDPRSFFDIAYYTSISCNLLNRLTPAREYRATASFGDKIPGTSYARYTRWFSTSGNFDQNGNTDVCFDSFVTLRMAGRIK